MANPNPSPATRFSVDRPGRAKQKGARDRLSAALLTALADDFEINGRDAVARTRQEDPAAYLRAVASLVPKEMEIHRPLDGISDEMLDAVIAAVKAVLDQESASPACPVAVN